MQIESHGAYAILGGVILGVGSGLSLGTAMDSLSTTLAFVVGLSLMWGMVFYAATLVEARG
jgi:hypothetical protein